MSNRRLPGLLTALLLCGAASAQSPPGTATQASPTAWRAPSLRVQGAEQPVRLQALRVDVEVDGRMAQTRVTMEFHNPNGRVLEGTLEFPLREGQVVSGFALDVDGDMRDAVPVEKARAQQVFEDISRRRVDPGLLQTTLGNNYELRIYPLPARGSRRVVLTLVEPIGRRLAVPLAYAEGVRHFELQVRYPTATTPPTIASPNPLGLHFERDPAGGYAARLQASDTTLPAAALDLLGPTPRDVTSVEERAGERYFSTRLTLPESSLPRTLPASLQLIWDASGSSAGRRLDREFALLDAYFRRAVTVDVNLVRVSDTAGPAERFAVRKGDWSSLRTALKRTILDGASNLGAVAWDGRSREALWFTDGLANYGGAWSLTFPVPVYAVNSAAAANPPALRALAESSGGRWIDLAGLSSAAAETALLRRGWQLLDVQSSGAREVVVASIHPDAGMLSIAGVLEDAEAVLRLRLRRPDGRVETRRVSITSAAPRSALAAAHWAQIQLARLEADAHANRSRITTLGRRFGLATSATSLIVLERVEDYLQHEIDPPPALQEAYERLAAGVRRSHQHREAERLSQVVRRFETRIAWWSTDYPKDTPRRALEPKSRLEIGAAGALGRNNESARRSTSAAPGSTAADAAPAAPMQRRQSATHDALKKARGPDDSGSSISIALKPPSPNAPYVRRLAAAPATQWLAIYLDERRDNTASVGFYLDVAEFFFLHGEPAQALRILSNLAEMDLQNRQVLRLLGYRLAQADAHALALPVFERVLELAPHEPQSHRDLGLALAQAGQPQAAIERLYAVVTGAWDARFPDIDLIALTELNAVVADGAAHGRPLTTAFIEPRLLRNLPLDLRVVLAWDADNTDVDLHVFDPNGEEVFFGHNASYQGGAITRDATGGYGPEEFALKVAKPGRYRVEANFYGHRQQVLTTSTGLMLWLSSDFGGKQQQDRRTTVRLRSQGGERVVIGEFEVGR